MFQEKLRMCLTNPRLHNQSKQEWSCTVKKSLSWTFSRGSAMSWWHRGKGRASAQWDNVPHNKPYEMGIQVPQVPVTHVTGHRALSQHVLWSACDLKGVSPDHWSLERKRWKLPMPHCNTALFPVPCSASAIFSPASWEHLLGNPHHSWSCYTTYSISEKVVNILNNFHTET